MIESGWFDFREESLPGETTFYLSHFVHGDIGAVRVRTLGEQRSEVQFLEPRQPPPSQETPEDVAEYDAISRTPPAHRCFWAREIPWGIAAYDAVTPAHAWVPRQELWDIAAYDAAQGKQAQEDAFYILAEKLRNRQRALYDARKQQHKRAISALVKRIQKDVGIWPQLHQAAEPFQQPDADASLDTWIAFRARQKREGKRQISHGEIARTTDHDEGYVRKRYSKKYDRDGRPKEAIECNGR